MTIASSPDDLRRRQVLGVFQMPSVQTMVSRKSSITNAFVNAVIPTIPPTSAEVEEALHVLGMTCDDIRCAYCGDPKTEWDHLRPLVLDRRPTGYVSEIANLVPACGKCNQSKGNKPWREWMLSKARLSPSGRGIADLNERIARLSAYERWRKPLSVDFIAILGQEAWDHYWTLCEAAIEELRQSQQVADHMRAKIIAALEQGSAKTWR